jgi:hypothetical protein
MRSIDRAAVPQPLALDCESPDKALLPPQLLCSPNPETAPQLIVLNPEAVAEFEPLRIAAEVT